MGEMLRKKRDETAEQAKAFEKKSEKGSLILRDIKETWRETENYICQKTNSISREIFLFNFDIYKK